MSQKSNFFTCPWCKETIKKARYPDVQSFYLSFEEGTTSDIFGPTLDGYEIEDMCTPCANKLKEKLVELGIMLNERDT